jgi:hypothetical protein
MLLALVVIPSLVSAWNIPTHMVNAAIAYQTLRRESPMTIAKVLAVLEKHPWYADRWRGQLEKHAGAGRTEMLFMLAARWPDDVRWRDRAHDRPQWHYINWPYKPDGEPVSIEPKPPQPINILTAIADNQRILRNDTPADQRAVALAWLFHLVGDVYHPLHTVQLFTREYPSGDRGGNEICVRVASDRPPLDLHQLWDDLITSSNNVSRLRHIARELSSKFPPAGLSELASADTEAAAKESYAIAVENAYQNGKLRGTPRGEHRDCREIADAAVLPAGYASSARNLADRRVVLAGYRLAGLLKRIFGN